uniref:Uncharacterized protein n=1 Tax=Panagrolaimus sp. JU765 TaxID=591449 RepID=A0AC34Q8Q1_9BILA
MTETNDLTEPLQKRNQKKRSRVSSFMEVSKPPIKFYSLKSVRLRICLLSMMGLFVSTSMRVSLNMAVVCMVNSTAYQVEITDKSILSKADQNCPRISVEEEEQKGYHGTFLWDSDQQSWLLSATFYGGLATTYLPTFMKQVLRVELSKNGFFAMMPFLTQLITKNIVAILSDYLKRKGHVSNTTGCKIFQCISNIGSAACFVVLAFFIDCHSLFLAVITLLFYGAFFSAGVCGFFTSQLSVAPQYTGLLFSI